MASVPVMITGVLWDHALKAGRAATFMGEATLASVGIGGGPMPGGPGLPVDPGYSPPWAQTPVDPGYSPPWARPKPPVDPGYSPPWAQVPTEPPEPPDEIKPPPPDGGWGWHPEYGWGYFPGQGGKPQPA